MLSFTLKRVAFFFRFTFHFYITFSSMIHCFTTRWINEIIYDIIDVTVIIYNQIFIDIWFSFTRFSLFLNLPFFSLNFCSPTGKVTMHVKFRKNSCWICA